MEVLLTAAQSRAADRHTIEVLKKPSRELMEAAADAVFKTLSRMVPEPASKAYRCRHRQ
ncbi:MAG: hypothetical protein R3B54_11095 [Bdellovibrionota bacterium]